MLLMMLLQTRALLWFIVVGDLSSSNFTIVQVRPTRTFTIMNFKIVFNKNSLKCKWQMENQNSFIFDSVIVRQCNNEKQIFDTLVEW